MSYVEVIKDAIGVLGFNEKSLRRLSKNPNGVGFGILTLGLAGLFSGIGSMQLLASFITPIFSILFFLIGFGYFHLMAKLFGGRASAREFFGPLANTQVITWIAIIPIIGPFINIIASLYLTVIQVYIMHKVHRIPIWAAILIIVIPIVLTIGLVIMALIFFAFSMSSITSSLGSI